MPQPVKSKRVYTGHVILGGRRPLISFQDLETSRTALNLSFRGFRQRLAAWFTATLPTIGIDLGGKAVTFSSRDEVYYHYHYHMFLSYILYSEC